MSKPRPAPTARDEPYSWRFAVCYRAPGVFGTRVDGKDRTFSLVTDLPLLRKKISGGYLGWPGHPKWGVDAPGDKEDVGGNERGAQQTNASAFMQFFRQLNCQSMYCTGEAADWQCR
jgi:hypothetical protein